MTHTIGHTAIPQSSVAGILIRELGSAGSALAYAERKARGSTDIAAEYDEACGMLRAEIAKEAHQRGLEHRAQAKAIVERYAQGSDAVLSEWEPSQAQEWEYANLHFGDIPFRIGVSTGGVISINGYPFTPDTRALITTDEALQKAIEPVLRRAREFQHRFGC
jgi:hypothetical protein